MDGRYKRRACCSGAPIQPSRFAAGIALTKASPRSAATVPGRRGPAPDSTRYAAAAIIVRRPALQTIPIRALALIAYTGKVGTLVNGDVIVLPVSVKCGDTPEAGGYPPSP